MSLLTDANLRNLRPKKSLAQHFLRDVAYLDLLLDAADIQEGDRVLEIGPGKGVLTAALVARGAIVTAVELDAALVQLLQAEYVNQPLVRILHGDILETDPSQVMGADSSADVTYKVAANLPYYITSAILRQLLEAQQPPSLAVVMVQKEVAERICAQPGDMSLLAVSVQFYAQPEMVATVPASAFYPKPKVDSAILRLDVLPTPAVGDVAPRQYFTVVRAGFGQRRKQIANSLSANLGLPKADVRKALDDIGIDARRRAETFSLMEWRSICIALGRV